MAFFFVFVDFRQVSVYNKQERGYDMIHIYIDAEFDAVRVAGKFTQAVISMGAVLTDEEGNLLDTFYALVKPNHFKKLNPIVGRITHLSTEDIKAAAGLKQVMSEFHQWIASYEMNIEHVQFYSFGPDDRRTLLQNCQYHNIEASYFERMKDLQKVLSMQVYYQEALVSPTLSLEDLKSVYTIHGEVEHNALTDARDLMMVYQAYCLGKPQDSTQIEAIVQRKLAKQEEVKRRQKEKLKHAMIKRFASLPKELDILFYPEVLDQLRSLKECGEEIPFRFRKDAAEDQSGNEIPYETLHTTLQLELTQEVPVVMLSFCYDLNSMTSMIQLTYRNATAFEIMIKRCLS